MAAVAPLPLLFMVLASTALLLALVALWSSLRRALAATSEGAPSVEGTELPDRAALLDEKKSLLRAIKDLEYEHAVGKISPDDFKRLDLAYRVRAKEVIAQDLAPYQAKAEALLEARIGAAAPRTDEAVSAPTDDADEEALRERARKLREEADRLERRATKAKAADADEPSSSEAKRSSTDAKPSERDAKPSEGHAKPSDPDAKPSGGDAKPSEGDTTAREIDAETSKDDAREEVSS
jgi:hypothetical protein